MFRTALWIVAVWASCFVTPVGAAAAPEPLILAVHPYLPAAEIMTRFSPLAEHLARVTGRPVKVRVGRDYQQHIEAIGTDSVDIAYMGPVPYVKLVARYGKRPFADHVFVASTRLSIALSDTLRQALWRLKDTTEGKAVMNGLHTNMTALAAAQDADYDSLRGIWLKPGMVSASEEQRVLGAPLAHEYNLLELLRRPEVRYTELAALPGAGPALDDAQVTEQIEIQAKYAGYIDRQRDEIDKQQRHEDTRLPEALDYAGVRGLSIEARQKLARHRPATLGQAARISGITPAAISLLLVYLRQRSA